MAHIGALLALQNQKSLVVSYQIILTIFEPCFGHIRSIVRLSLPCHYCYLLKGLKNFIKTHPRLNEQKNIKCNKRDHICPLGHMMAKLAIDTISSFPCPNYLKVKSAFLRNIWILRPFQVHVLTSLGHVLVVLNITYLSAHLLLYSSINMEFLTIHFN